MNDNDRFNYKMQMNLIFGSDEDIDKLKAICRRTRRVPLKLRGIASYDRENDELRYINGGFDLLVVKKADIPGLLKDLYANDSAMLGKGGRSIYRYLSSIYANITLAEVEEFLKAQPGYQLV